MNCSKCGKPLDPNQKFCPSCGAPTTQKKAKKTMMATPGMLPGMLEELQKAGKLPPVSKQKEPTPPAPMGQPAPAPMGQSAPAPVAPAPMGQSAPAPTAPAPMGQPAPAPTAPAPVAPAPMGQPVPQAPVPVAPAPMGQSAPAPAPVAPAPMGQPAPIDFQNSISGPSNSQFIWVALLSLAFIFSAISVFSTSWFSGSKRKYSVNIGLMKNKMCLEDECKSEKIKKNDNNKKNYYSAIASYYFGIFNILAMLGIVIFGFLKIFKIKDLNNKFIYKILPLFSYGIYAALGIAFIIFTKNKLSDENIDFMSLSYSAYSAYIGFALVIAALFIDNTQKE